MPEDWKDAAGRVAYGICGRVLEHYDSLYLLYSFFYRQDILAAPSGSLIH